MIRLVIDCFGGDHSPEANVEGALEALEKFDNLQLILTGDESAIRAELDRLSYTGDRVEILHAPEVIGCDEKPTEAIRHKQNSSMMKAIDLLRTDGSVAGMVSIGSTGALVAAGVLRVGRLRGVLRPAFCPLLPTMDGGIVGVCDSGANVDCSVNHLQQFAVMGTLYLQCVYGKENPRVALLNIGVEAEKGDTLRKETYPVLAETPGISFVGNMESRDLLTGEYDLVVCDGFAGNVLIKSTEGACLEILKKLKQDISSRWLNKIGGILLYKMFKKEKAFMNYQNYGGSVLLGTKKVIVKGHGSSKSTAICKCIEQAYRMEAGGFNEKAEEALCALPSAK